MKTRTGVLGGLLVLVATGGSQGQEPHRTLSQYHHTAWVAKDGAPSGVWALAQTSDGFLWLGSTSGLYRFDGVRFEPFQPKSASPPPGIAVTSLLAPPDSGLWVGFQLGGVGLFQGDSLQLFGAESGLPGGTVWSLGRAPDGTIWAGTSSGLARRVGPAWRPVGPNDGFTATAVFAVAFDRGGRLWAGSDSGLFVADPTSRRFTLVRRDPARSDVPGLYRFLAPAPDSSLWAASSSPGIWNFRMVNGHATQQLVRHSTPGPMLVDRHGDLWMGVEEEAVEHFWPSAGNQFAPPPWSQRLTRAGGLSAEFALCWLQDREGNIWAGTNGGLDRFRPTKLTIVTTERTFAFPAIASGPSGGAWIGSELRPLIAVNASGQFRLLSLPATLEAIYPEPGGGMWFGGYNGLWYLVGGKLRKVALPEGTFRRGIQAITRDGRGALWVSIVRKGVYQMARSRWIQFGGRPELELVSGGGQTALVLRTDSAGRTWFGYPKSRLGMIHGDTTRVYTRAEGLDVGNVRAVYGRGTHLWVGGETGLVRLATDRFHPVLRQDGARFRGVTGVLETARGELWLQTLDGIVRIPASELERASGDTAAAVNYELLDFHDGLQGSNQNIRPQPNIIEDSDGLLWFATETQVSWLDPTAITRNTLAPPVVIRGLTVGSTHYPGTGELQLPVRPGRVHIDYTALSLSIPERVRFRSRLLGSDEAWQESDRREIEYSNLGPGSYTFEVTAANEDGVWNPSGARLRFVVPPALTQALWFRILAALSAGAAIWVLSTTLVHRRARLQFNAALAERTRIAQELHDSLLQSFTGIALHLRAITQSVQENSGNVADRLRHLTATADASLHEARAMIGDIRAVELVDHDLPRALERAGRTAVEGTGVAFTCGVAGGARPLPSALKHAAFQIAREALVNAVRHATPRSIRIELEYRPSQLLVRVQDDGQGVTDEALARARATGHWGITGMTERARRWGGSLEITSPPTGGTTVTLTLPIHRSPRGPIATPALTRKT